MRKNKITYMSITKCGQFKSKPRQGNFKCLGKVNRTTVDNVAINLKKRMFAVDDRRNKLFDIS